MTKADLVRNLVYRSKEEVNQKQVSAILEVLPEVIIEALKGDDYVTIPDIGKISVKEVPERKGKIMMGSKIGEKYVIPAHREPKMKLAKNFKECLL